MNAWASGMLREQGGGLEVYLAHLGFDDLLTVHTFEPAAIDTIATAAEQRAFFDRWFGESHTNWAFRPGLTPILGWQLTEAISWRVAAEVAHHDPDRVVITETHPGGSQYDCLSLREAQTGVSLLDANREGRIHFPPIGAGETIDWTELVSAGGLVDAVERAASTLKLSTAVRPSTPRVLAYRVMAEVVGLAALSMASVEWRSGYRDSSLGSGLRSELFAAFPQIERQPSPWPWAPEAASCYWFLLVGEVPVAAVDLIRGTRHSQAEGEDSICRCADADRFEGLPVAIAEAHCK